MIRLGWWASLGCGAIIIHAHRVQAQAVVPDGTVGTVIVRSGDDFTITGGSTAGTNLFHSFQEFSIPTGGSALFNNATTIQNIFSRVTGSSISNIDGTIRSNGTANLFLLNPSGILFGPNASLNIGGSFVGTTANSIKFADGMEFRAISPTSPQLLTISAPIGLQMGSNSGPIEVQGTGHGLTTPLPILLPLMPSEAPTSNLQVQSGQTFAFVGNGVRLNGANLQAASGYLQLGSLSSGTVKLQPQSQGWSLDYNPASQFSPITLSHASSLDVSGEKGSIDVQGSQVTFQDGSILRSTTLGNQDAGRIQINAQDTLSFIGANLDSTIGSGVIVDTIGQGRGANVDITARNALFQNGGVIASRTYGAGNGGIVNLKIAESANFLDFAPANPFLISGVFSVNWLGSTGKAGDIQVSTTNLKLTNGASVYLNTFGAGAGENLKVFATGRIELTGMSPLLNPSGLSSSNAGTSQQAGRTVIRTNQLVISEGGAVLASTVNSGKAGDIEIYATESIVVQGQKPGSQNPSSINSSAFILDPVQRAIFGFPEVPSGPAGSVIINTPLLQVLDGADISVRHPGQGNAGRLEINAKTISLNTRGNLSASTNGGSGGNLFLNADLIQLRQNSVITATAKQAGDGGNITINSSLILGLENSDIIANADDGRGGNINVITQGIIGLEFRNTLTPRQAQTNDITASSGMGVNGTVQINTIGAGLNSGLIELPDTLVDATQKMAKGCQGNPGNDFVISGRGGIPSNPRTASQTGHILWQDLRAASAPSSSAAHIPAPTPLLVGATAWRRNPHSGKVELVAEPTSVSATGAIAPCKPTSVSSVAP